MDWINRTRIITMILHLMYLCYSMYNMETYRDLFVPLHLMEEGGHIVIRPLQNDEKLFQIKFYKVLTPCIGLIVLELVSYLAGISLFVKAQQKWSSFCHFAGILLLYYMFYLNHATDFLFWAVLFPSILPFASELCIIIQHYLRMY